MITPERIDEICTKQFGLFSLEPKDQKLAAAIIRLGLNDDEEREYWDQIT